MSEQSPLQSSVGVFVEWAKARLDEMAASAKVLVLRLDSLDVNIRASLNRQSPTSSNGLPRAKPRLRMSRPRGRPQSPRRKLKLRRRGPSFRANPANGPNWPKTSKRRFKRGPRPQAQAWQNVVNSYICSAQRNSMPGTRRRLRRMSRSSRPMLRRPRPISKRRSMILARPVRHHGLP